MNEKLYKQVYYHAVRRALLETETVLKRYMDEIASKYTDEELSLLDEFMVEIPDNDLLDLIVSRELPVKYKEKYGWILDDISLFVSKFNA